MRQSPTRKATNRKGFAMFDSLSEKFAHAFRALQGNNKISPSNIEATLKEIRGSLLEADVNFRVVKEFTAAVRERAMGEEVLQGVSPGEQFIKIVQDELARVMGQAHQGLDLDRPKPLPILVVGLNGQGKTTFAAKLALHLKEKHKQSVLLVPADTFRPAAKEQLATLAEKVGVDFFDSNLAHHPRHIAAVAMGQAKREHRDIVIIDTAGRLHVDDGLMKQMVEIKRAVASYGPEVLMVADAMTGQEAVTVAKHFHAAVQLNGVALSKMDSDARGGAALSIRHVTGVPIKYLSTGEKMQDLELFHPDRLAGRILDKGDVVSLVEKAQAAIDEREADNMMKRIEKGQFSVEDLMKQMDIMKGLGNLSSVLKMLPGMGGALRKLGDLTPADNEIKRIRVLIDSMTYTERKNYKIIKSSRMERIAKGSGHDLKTVRNFLDNFGQMEKVMGSIKHIMRGGGPTSLANLYRGIKSGKGGGKKSKVGPQLAGVPKRKKGKGRGPWGGGFFR